METTKKMTALGHEVEIFLLHHSETHLVTSLQQIDGVKLWKQRSKRGLYNPFWIFTLRKLLNQEKFDVVHVHLFPALYWVGIGHYLSKRRNKLFYTEHNTTNRRRNSVLMKMADRLIYNQYDHIITISDAVDENLKLHLRNPSIAITKVYNGINLEEIKRAVPYAEGILNLPQESRILLQVSSFTLQKDQSTLIKALGHLPPNYHSVFVGDGPTRPACEALARQLGLENRVHFMGIRNDVPRLLKTADFVVLSSHFEGLSLSSVEGMASGNPFLASDVPGLREVVVNAGLLFEEGNFEALAGHILTLSSNKEHCLETVNKCQKRAENFDIDVMVNQYVALYEKDEIDNNINT